MEKKVLVARRKMIRAIDEYVRQVMAGDYDDATGDEWILETSGGDFSAGYDPDSNQWYLNGPDGFVKKFVCDNTEWEVRNAMEYEAEVNMGFEVYDFYYA